MTATLTAHQRRTVALEQWAGVAVARVARSTGTLVVVFDGAAAGMDTEGGRWSVVCDDHGAVAACGNLHLATRHAAHPESWCEECAEVL